MADYLLEIGTEELPADHVPEAQERLKNLMTESLTQSNVKFKDVSTMGTPRRLVCLVQDIATVQDTVQKKVKGPPVKNCFDADGKPTKAAVGFAEKQGLSVDKLDREEIGGAEYVVANLTITGKPTAEVLQDIVPGTIMQLSGERPMRWGASEMKFSRPIRWIVSLIEDKEVTVKVENIVSGRHSFGNRVLAPGKVEIANTKTYAEALRKARVIVDPAERQELIEKQVKETAASVSGRPKQLKGSLLQEVVNILEWPHAVLGEYGAEYLDLPDTLVETIMIHHQRYFPVERAANGGNGGNGNKLLPYFITVANNDRPQAQPIIKLGNERVIRARLADGKFFYFDDQKTPLSERRPDLAKLTFQEGLGSYQDKTDRLVTVARKVSDELRLEDRVKVCLERALELCKLDLVTNLVRELPELQGYVGSWYAAKEQQPPDVVAAIASHYQPRTNEDAIPADEVGQFASLIDRLDTLVALFALGRRPSGSSDPYAMRRQGQGVVDIVVDGLNKYSINVSALLEAFLNLVQPKLEKKKGFDPAKTLADVREFLLQRLKLKLQEKGLRREVIEAVMDAGDPLADMNDVVVRCQVIEETLGAASGVDNIRVGGRIGNILAANSAGQVDPAVFDNDAEKQLWESFQNDVAKKWNGGKFRQPTSSAEYKQMLQLLEKLIKPVELFFEKVMVNDPDAKKKANRHAMLHDIYVYYGCVADFRKLQPLLP